MLQHEEIIINERTKEIEAGAIIKDDGGSKGNHFTILLFAIAMEIIIYMSSVIQYFKFM